MDGPGSTLRFQWHDYILFVLMLTGSTAIGIYFGLAGKNSKIKDYLFGGKNMAPFPIAISLATSAVSAISMTAIPADVYKFGGMIWLTMIGIQLALVFTYYAILPVFFNLQFTSVFEYFELRFNRTLRSITSCVFTVGIIILLPVLIFMPAVIVSQSTGLNVYLLCGVVFGICVFYTTIGGIKAVVWTDVLQGAIILLSMLVVIIMGTIRLDGFNNIWKSSWDGGRLDIDFSLDPTIRDTFWSIFVGFSFVWAYGMGNQNGIQKCQTLPTMADVKKTYIWYGIIMAIIYFIITYTGLVLYTEFKDCDPLRSGKIRSYDQMVPYFIMVLTSDLPGLAGIFIAGITSGAISSISGFLNAVACIIYNDFVKNFVSENLPEKKIKNILGIIVFIVGLISCGLIFIVAKLGGIFAILISFSSITAGPILGLFIFGMFSTTANTKGAYCGFIGSVLFMAWIIIGKQYYTFQKYIVDELKPVSTQGCTTPVNQTLLIYSIINSSEKSESEWTPLFLYRISFYHYTIIGVLFVIIIGLPVSWLTKEDRPVRQDLISPVMQWTFNRKNKKTYDPIITNPVELINL